MNKQVEIMTKKRFLYIILIVLLTLVALAVRLYYLGEYSYLPLFDTPKGADVEEYCSWAKNIIAGQILWEEVQIHSPLYPVFLAILFKSFLTFNKIFFIIRFSQILMVFFACLPILASLTIIKKDKKAISLIFFALWCWYPPLIYYAGELTSESLVIFLLSIVLYILYKAETILSQKSDVLPEVDLADENDNDNNKNQIGSRILFSIAGIFTGLAVITHPIVLFFLFLESVYFIFQKKFLNLILFFIGVSIIVAPLLFYNVIILGESVAIQKNSGFNLFLGNNEKSDGTCYLRPGPDWKQAHEIAEIESKNEGISKNTYLIKSSFKFIFTHPLNFLSLTFKKAIYFWNHNELTSGADLHFLKYYTNYMKFFKWAFGFCAVLALMAIFINFKNFTFLYKYRHFLLLIGAFWIAQTIFVVSGRYRIAAVPAILVLAAWSLSHIPDFFKLNHKNKIYILLLLALLSSLVFLPQPPLHLEKEKAEAYSLLGEACMLRNENLAAESYLSYALKHDPDNPRNYNLIGIIKEKRGENKEAVEYYLCSLNLDKKNQYTLMNLAMFFAKHGHQKRAEQFYRKAFSTHKKPSAELYYNYALFCYNNGRKKEAFANYLRCIVKKPAHVEALNNLGVLLLQVGEPKEATKYFRMSLEQNPGNPDRMLNLAIAEYALGNRNAALDLVNKTLQVAPKLEKAELIKQKIKNDQKLKIIKDVK
jgi:Tfp pilus assembly protein PilF